VNPASLGRWEPLDPNSFKLKFDGASKGNPGPAGYGSVIRNNEGRILGVQWRNIGINTNNITELEGLIMGVQWVIQKGWKPLIIEGDSKLIITMARKIQLGQKATKAGNNWRMEARLENLAIIIGSGLTLSFKHALRSANKVADVLANMGVRGDRVRLEEVWEEIQD